MATNASILAAFERMWQHIITALGNKADTSEIPTKTSQLVNDSGYVSTGDYLTFTGVDEDGNSYTWHVYGEER